MRARGCLGDTDAVWSKAKPPNGFADAGVEAVHAISRQSARSFRACGRPGRCNPHRSFRAEGPSVYLAQAEGLGIAKFNETFEGRRSGHLRTRSTQYQTVGPGPKPDAHGFYFWTFFGQKPAPIAPYFKTRPFCWRVGLCFVALSSRPRLLSSGWGLHGPLAL